MKKLPFISSSLLTSTLLTAGQAFGGAECPEAPQSQWLSKIEMQRKILNDYRFAIRSFVIDNNCYEIYGWETDEKGLETRQIEVYFNPVNGKIVKKKAK